LVKIRGKSGHGEIDFAFVPLILDEGLLVVFVTGVASPAIAQSKSINWQRLDVDIAFQPNGDLRITETNAGNSDDNDSSSRSSGSSGSSSSRGGGGGGFG